MKTKVVVSWGIIFLLPGSAVPQVTVTPGVGYGAHYPFWSYGWGGPPSSSELMRAQGWAEMMRVQGEYEKADAEAVAQMDAARAAESQRRAEQRRQYNEMKAARAAQQRAERMSRNAARQQAASLDRGAEDQFPETLTATEFDAKSGKINWPASCQADKLASVRGKAQEGVDAWVRSTANTEQAIAAVDDALGTLRTHIRTMDTESYLSARHFLERLEMTIRKGV